MTLLRIPSPSSTPASRAIREHASLGGLRRVKMLRFALYTVILVMAHSFLGQSSFQHLSPQNKDDNSSGNQLKQAEAFIQDGKLKEARLALQQFLINQPSDAEAYNLLGLVEFRNKDYTNAIQSLQKAIQLAPGSSIGHINLGNVYIAEGKSRLAQAEFREVLRREPSNRDANYNLGLLLIAQGSPSEAISHFQRIQPADTATGLNLIRAYLESGRTAQALKNASELTRQYQNNAQFHFTLGILLAEHKEYQIAQQELKQADALLPDTFEILYSLGEVFLQSSQYAQSELTLTKALKLHPSSAETLYLLAKVSELKARPVDALEYLIRAHRLMPQNIEVILLMAKISISQSYFEDAIPLLESASELAPHNPDVLSSLGSSYFMSGKIDKAITSFLKLIEVAPTARSYSFLGLCYRSLGRFDQAVKYLQKGLSLNPKDPSCLFNLGLIEEHQGDPVEAERRFQQILAVNPRYSDALLELANLLNDVGNIAQAQKLLKQYVEVSNRPSVGYYKLAMIERALHHKDAAEQDFEMFQALTKKDPSGPLPFENLFDYLDQRNGMTQADRNQMDIAQLLDEVKSHPEEPENFYLLTEAYLRAGRTDEARNAMSQFNALTAFDYRSQTGIGVLLARYRIYDAAIERFRSALNMKPDSNDIKFNLATAYFRTGNYPESLKLAEQLTNVQQPDEASWALLGDVYSHLGDYERAEDIFLHSIERNPDNDQYYLSLALTQLRQSKIVEAQRTLEQGQARIAQSGKLCWGLGVTSVMQADATKAAHYFTQALNNLPEWSASYSALGIFYFQSGQYEKARELLGRFKESDLNGGLDSQKIQALLASAPATDSKEYSKMSTETQAQFLRTMLTLADRTL